MFLLEGGRGLSLTLSVENVDSERPKLHCEGEVSKEGIRRRTGLRMRREIKKKKTFSLILEEWKPCFKQRAIILKIK